MRFARFAATLLIGGAAVAYAAPAALAAGEEGAESRLGQSFADFSGMKAQPGAAAPEGARLPQGGGGDVPTTFSSSSFASEEPELVPLDLDENGEVDAIGVDTNGDGYFDIVYFDEDEDGVVESAMFDLDYDGVADMWMTVATDDQGNPVDVYEVDEDGDGEADFYGFDLDQDGEIDEWQEA